ncbi:MAG: PilZ domain-containing protein [Endomicrobiia bacterium]|nr:PilZ domain-containing protein [Endomicrobiia bacterium]
MDKRRHDRVDMSISCRIANARRVFGVERGRLRNLARAVIGKNGDGDVLGTVSNISSGGAMIEIDRKDFNEKLTGGKNNFYMLASDERLKVELKTAVGGEHITCFDFLPSRIRLSREKIQIGGAFIAGSKTLIPVKHRDASGLVITWP